MIEGFKLDFTSQDLKDHLNQRRDFHGEKELSYRKQAEGVASIKGGDFQGQTVDPQHALEQRANDHRSKHDFFSLMAAHIVPDEIYRLTQNDLVLLELISRGY